MLLFSISPAGAQRWALSTSGTQWLTGTGNLDIGYASGSHVTLHAEASYNPWRFGDVRAQQLTVRPGLRIWPRRTYSQWFLSTSALVSRFNMGGVFSGKYRYDGYGYGMALGGGYSRILSGRLNLEVEVAAGLLWNDFDKLTRLGGSRLYRHERLWKVVPAKADISLVYIL